jgi:hypothetical protein
MSKSNILFLFVFLWVLIGCQSTEKSPPKKRTFCTVICDVSSSTTLLDSKKVNGGNGQLEKVKRISTSLPLLKRYEIGSEFHCYPISDNMVQDQIAKFLINPRNKSDLISCMGQYRKDSLQLCRSLENIAPMVKNSCIITSLERCIMKHFEPHEGDFLREIVLISDMVEYCSHSSGEEIAMSAIDKRKLEIALNEISGYAVESDPRLAEMKVNIYLVNTWVGDLLPQIKLAWNEYLTRRGFAADSIVYFTSDPGESEFNLRLYDN